MFDASTYSQRRTQLLNAIPGGLILLLGNEEVGMNYQANTYAFRQDSNFLYFFGLNQPGLMAILDADNGSICLYGNDPTMEDMVWTGPQPVMAELGDRVGVKKTESFDAGINMLAQARKSGRTIHFLPPYRARNTRFLHENLGIALDQVPAAASVDLIRAVVSLRSIKSNEEIAEMEEALRITKAMHLAMMQGARPGLLEMELAGQVEGIAASGGGGLAYPVIMSVNGQVLHNHHHDQIMQEGQLLLGDFGAQTSSCYAGDITRTIPVSATFSPLQRDLYQVVLDAQMEAINACRPGTSYQAIHLQAAKTMTAGLVDLGLMKGDPAEAVAAGAHALFFPHGLGHMIGMDVHDMEDLGEQYVGYDETVTRSDQFGTAYLRLGKKLQAGFVLTVEPGLYIIPELIDLWQKDKKFSSFICYDKLADLRTFGGIRIEDNILVTDNDPKVLGPAIPKTVSEIEDIRRAALAGN
ncbi:MAG: aminopeptidase P family protein [Saprospiraceae bacterium]|nr:aminopeptidase P family protein [Saprospiraceae bacterium]